MIKLLLRNGFILPHESDMFVNSKEIIKNADLIIAEVSYQSTGSGIELGWAEGFGKKVIFIYKKGSIVSGSLTVVSRIFIEYTDNDDLINQLSKVV